MTERDFIMMLFEYTRISNGEILLVIENDYLKVGNKQLEIAKIVDFIVKELK